MPDLTPQQWLTALEPRLAVRQPDIARFEAYYAGRHRLAFDSAPYREAFGEQLADFCTNWCGLVVDTPVERLAVIGFRFGQPEVEGPGEIPGHEDESSPLDADTPAPVADVSTDANAADEDAWDIWQANYLDAESVKAHTEAGKLGIAFLLVSPPGDDGIPRITVEHPSQMIVVVDPSNRRRRLAAMKRYTSVTGDAIAVIYTPEYIATFRSVPGLQSALQSGLLLPSQVTIPAAMGGGLELVSQVPNPLGVVPVIPMENNPGLLTQGMSDLRPALSLNDAANKFFDDMIVASEFAAFPQRVLTGAEIPKDSEGQPLPGTELEASMKRLWVVENDQARVSSLVAADLSNYVAAIDTAIQHLAAQTRTPPHYLLAKLANLSADALQAAETGLVSKVRRKQLDYGDSWEEAMRLAFGWRALWRAARDDMGGATLDAQRAVDMSAETIWMSPESRSPAVIADALVKKRAIGVPEITLWEEAGYTPRQIERMLEQRKQELDEIAARQRQTIAEGGKVTIAERDVVPGGA